MNCYEVIAGPPVFAEIKALLKSVQLGTSTIVSKKGLISYDDSIEVVQPTDILRYFIEAGLDHSSNKALTNIFLAHLSSTEINSAGSGVIFCTAFCNYLQKGLRFQQLNKKSPIEYHTFSGKKARLQDLEKTLSSFFDEGTCGLILKAANTIGSEGSISVTTHSTNHRSSLTIDDMYRFDASVNDIFIQQTGRSLLYTSPSPRDS